jgi:hypothetical protein
MVHKFYVYMAWHPITGMPIYVGKGHGNRHRYHNKNTHNLRLANAIQKYGHINFFIIRDGISEREAFQTEMALIEHFGRADLGLGTLYNLTNGGEGTSGPKTPEWRAKIGLRHKGKIVSAETGARISASKTGYKMSDETRARMSASHKGKSLSDAHVAAARSGLKGVPKSEAHREALSRSKKGKPAHPNVALAASAFHRGKPKTPEHNAKVKAALLAFHAAKRAVSHQEQ